MTTSAEQYREKAVEFLEQADRSYDATRVAMATSIAMVYAELAKTAPNTVSLTVSPNDIAEAVYGSPVPSSSAVPYIQDVDDTKMPSEFYVTYDEVNNVAAYEFLQRIIPTGYRLVNFDETDATFGRIN